jgi:methionine-S-sulfoxide reductase
MTTQTAILAGGCFWGMQDLIRRRPGVVSTRVGYSGGDVANATYRNHGTHAEAIEITFDPAKTSFRALLELFFQIHDPTTKNRQGNDVGTAYRSAIYYVDETQRETALETIRRCRCVRSLAWQGRDGGCARRSVLAGRAGASGLSRALSERLYLPFPASGLVHCRSVRPESNAETPGRSVPAFFVASHCAALTNAALPQFNRCGRTHRTPQQSGIFPCRISMRRPFQPASAPH